MKIKTKDVAREIGSSEETIRQLMIKGVPWGEALQKENSSTFTYVIYPGKYAEYFGQDALERVSQSLE